jgi:hypothetical protein
VTGIPSAASTATIPLADSLACELVGRHASVIAADVVAANPLAILAPKQP